MGASAGLIFAVRGISWKIGGKLAARRVDGRLNITSRGIDIAIQFELQSYTR